MTSLIFPGQGAQHKGMGASLFQRFAGHVRRAEAILGYDILRCCLEDPDGQLQQTRYTQPALYLVNALSYLAWREDQDVRVDWLAGHSLGEFNALFAAGVFDFETGLRLVQKRGEIMAAVSGGGMAAVVGLEQPLVAQVLQQQGLEQIDIANLNTPTQMVLSGPLEAIRRAEPVFVSAGARAFVPLKVSGAFHSRYMQTAHAAFADFLGAFDFKPAQIPVVSNYAARPYREDNLAKHLGLQLCHPVRWSESVRYIWGQGEETFIELGPGRVLTGLVQRIRQESSPLPPQEEMTPAAPPAQARVKGNAGKRAAFPAGAAFCTAFAVEEPYLMSGMAWGVSSEAAVMAMAESGRLGFFGAEGLAENVVDAAVGRLLARLPAHRVGVRVDASPFDHRDADLLRRLTGLGVTCIEAAGYLQADEALVAYRFGGEDGPRRLLAQVNRPEGLGAFLSPPPVDLLDTMRAKGTLNQAQHALARQSPMADALCIMAEGSGETQRGSHASLLPLARQLRDQLAPQVSIGAGGGLGTPEALAACMLMGAEFVMTGSINALSLESGLSPLARDLLRRAQVQDTGFVPSLRLFDWGEQCQVLKKGVLYAARAGKLYDLYRFYPAWQAIPAAERERLEGRYFQADFASLLSQSRAQGHRGEPADEKARMALVFCQYLRNARHYAITGQEDRVVDFHIDASPAVGAFNHWFTQQHAANAPLVSVAEMADRLMQATGKTLQDWRLR
jgi:trans-AT polyketide synthase/acyltransferase/oxidoreductase domain-containing protein